ncbi:MAG: ribulose-phosphate 3-epimerase [Lactobacillales bacterium]|nr:ribulose-phosphate 3-epimerase [Lactobacillales bacterium]
MIAVSILGIKEDKLNNYKKIDNTSCDYIHLDVMDGIFVENKVDFDFNYNFNKKLDIHLMVKNVEEYINKYKVLNPEFITFHIEVEEDIDKLIKILKDNNIKVGISIKPNTDINLLNKYLPYIDLILVMSVEPGRGGQKFIEESTNRINYLKEIREKNNYKYLIEVDGGINYDTISKVSNADIKVVGSYITNNDNYEEQIKTLK